MSSIVDRIDELYDTCTHAEVEKFMVDERERMLASPEGNLPDLIAVCNELGALLREQSRYAESAYNFELALQKTEELLGTRFADEYAVLLLNVAGTYRYAGEFEKALAYYLTANEILTATGKQGTYEYASLLNNMSNVLQDMREFDQALEYATASNKIIGELCAGQTEEAVSLMNLAALALRVQDYETADACCKRAIQIYEDLDNHSGHYPAAINLAAVIAFKTGRNEEALEGFRHSAELTYNHFGANRDYASALVNIATVLEAMGRADEAAQTMQEAQDVRAGLK